VSEVFYFLPFYPVSISGAQQKEKYLFSLRSQRLCGEIQ